MDRSAFVAAMVSELKTQSIRPGGLAARKPSWERACQDLATDMPEGRGDDLLALLAELGPRGSPSAWERVTPAVLSGLAGLCSRHLASQLPASPLAEAARALALGPTASADLAPEADSGSEDEDAGPKTAAGAMQTAGADSSRAAARLAATVFLSGPAGSPQGLTACSELVRLCEAAGGRWQAAVDELVFLAEDEEDEDEDEDEEGYPGGAGAGAHGRERAVAERVAVAAGGAGGIGVSMDLAGAGSGATLRRTAAGAAAASAAAAASSEDCDGGESGGAGLAAGDGDGDDAAAKAVQRARWLRSRAVAERRAAVEGAVAALEALGAGAGAAAAAVGGTGFMPRCLDRKRLAGLVRATLEAALDGRDIGGDAVDKGRGSSSTPAAVRAARVRRAERLELLQLASSRLAVALRRATAPLKAGPTARAPGNKAD
ncbi:hypothetical protein FNF27_06081 [Cafeteria roenbergensis]|uniref:Uncharacterized protein n=1 Tax=Cafeteria roenbergensis TaxID=33653 RepID=A0A5A8E3E2_CAFRO|nr:hypothetical protein FNF27_06081 [Cafeteria roenbergensis]